MDGNYEQYENVRQDDYERAIDCRTRQNDASISNYKNRKDDKTDVDNEDFVDDKEDLEYVYCTDCQNGSELF